MTPPYLQPYRDAARRFGGGFSALLWASPKSQRARFNALTQLESFSGRFVLDLGCGRCDFLAHLMSLEQYPSRYIGIEAIGDLAAAARARKFPNARILEADFIRDPSCMNVAPEIIVFCGSLNTLDESAFYATLSAAFAQTRSSVIFNFLSSPLLAGKPFLYWHHPLDMAAFARSLTPHVRQLDGYLDGDCTICMRKTVSSW